MQNTMRVMAEIGQQHLNNVRDLNIHEEKELNELAKECKQKVNHESDEQKEVRVRKKVVELIQPTKHVPINYFCAKYNKKAEHKNKDNIFQVFIDNTVM